MLRRKGPGRVPGGVAIPAVATCCIGLRSATAFAGAGACALSIRAEGLDEKWTAEVEAVRAALAHRADVDSCAFIVLERPANGGASATVVLKDGRSTERTLTDPRDLRAIVTALVLLPAPAAPDTEKTQDETAVLAVETVQPGAAALDREVPTARDKAPSAATSPSSGHSHTRVDLGGRAGTRWSGGSPAGSIGVFADAWLGDWVLGAHGRWDGYATTSGLVDYTTRALEAGADFGRDFRIGATSLTLLGGPRFVALSQNLKATPTTVYASSVNPKTGNPIGSVTPSARHGQVLRVGSALRWSLLSRKRVTLFVDADAEVDVTHDAGNSMPSSFAATNLLPAWSASLSVGGAVAVWP